MKGHNSGNSKGRQYAIMLLLAFGAAILGVLILHKLRERRIFSILVKEKDHQLISLHLLLQKERDHNTEVKTKIKEMKEKMYSIRNQKMELDSRILEMESTISSLKDEQKTLETTLEEKQNEIKFLREKETEPHMENSQLITLTETLKQKDTEIQELKQRIENPANIPSLSTNDLSDLTQNSSSNNSQDHVVGKEIGNDENGVNVEATKMGTNSNTNISERASVTETKSENIGVIATNVEKLSLQGNDEGGEKQNEYANEINQKRLRLRAKQQRQGGEKYNKRSRFYGKQNNGRYKKIVNEILQNRVIHKKDESNQDTEMGKNSRIGIDEQIKKVQRNTSFDVLNNTTTFVENDEKIGELQITKKIVDSVQVQRLETNDDERVQPIVEEENVIKKNETGSEEMKEADEDYKVSEVEKEEEKGDGI